MHDGITGVTVAVRLLGLPLLSNTVAMSAVSIASAITVAPVVALLVTVTVPL